MAEGSDRLESPPPDEGRDIARVIESSGKILELGKPVLRGQHAKGTGGVRARFEVCPSRPDETKFGIFAETRGYDAYVRFSNGVGRLQADTRKDARGMAIKVLGVEGARAFEEEDDRSTQDFVMINFPVFAFRDARQYADFMGLKRRCMGLLGPKGNDLAQLLFFIPWHFGQFWRIGRKIKRRSASVLSEQYWSMSAYRLGHRAVKFSAQPQWINSVPTAATPAPDPAAPDFLSRTLAAHLREREARFDFLVQIQTDPVATPVEDPTIVWEESVSPPMKVATVIIERADLTTPEAEALRASIEAMSFNPWHSLVGHEPLGGINRLRREVYRENARMRRESRPG